MRVPQNFKTSLLASALAAAIAAPVFAQQTGQGYGAPQQQQQSQQQQPTQQQQQAQDNRLDVRVSKLIGMNVRNAQGENLGDVNDIVLDTRNNQVHYVVLSHGGLLGMGADLFAFPLQSFELARDLESLVLNIDRAALREAQGFDRNRWPDLADDRYWTDVDRRFGQARTQAADQRQGAAAGQALRRASEIMGTNIIGSGDEQIGEINDVVVDLRSGEIQYAIVEFDRGWFAQDRQAALPLNRFQELAGRNDLRLGMTREQLAQAPGFDRRGWTNFNDPDFRAQVDRFSTATQPQPAPRTGSAAFGTPPAQLEETRREVAGLDGIQGMQQPTPGAGLTFDQLARGEGDRIRRDDLMNTWSEMDRNSDGTVTRYEFNQYLRQRSPR